MKDFFQEAIESPRCPHDAWGGGGGGALQTSTVVPPTAEANQLEPFRSVTDQPPTGSGGGGGGEEGRRRKRKKKSSFIAAHTHFKQYKEEKVE